MNCCGWKMLLSITLKILTRQKDALNGSTNTSLAHEMVTRDWSRSFPTRSINIHILAKREPAMGAGNVGFIYRNRRCLQRPYCHLSMIPSLQNFELPKSIMTK